MTVTCHADGPDTRCPPDISLQDGCSTLLLLFGFLQKVKILFRFLSTSKLDRLMEVFRKSKVAQHELWKSRVYPSSPVQGYANYSGERRSLHFALWVPGLWRPPPPTPAPPCQDVQSDRSVG